MSDLETKYESVVNLLRDCVYKLQLKTGYTDTDELMSEANWAFLVACEKYDPKRGSFSNYVWVKVTGHLLTYYGNRVREKTREEEGVKGKQISERFSLRRFLFDLSEDARILSSLSLEPPVRRKGSSTRETVIAYLKDCGWSMFRIRRGFKEIEEALRS